MNIFEKAIRKSRYEYHCRRLRRRLTNHGFTIISQNCIGGIIYHMMGMQFTSPTINMFIEGENFVKLVTDLRHYMGVKAEPLIERYVDPIDSSIVYPKILVDDLEMCCLHYRDCKDAIESWERRRKRVNYDNVYVIANSWNMHQDADLIRRVLSTEYKTICFTYGAYDFEGCVQLKGDFWSLDERGIVRPNLMDYKPHSHTKLFEDYIDIVSWLNY